MVAVKERAGKRKEKEMREFWERRGETEREGHSQGEVFGRSKRGAKEELISFGPGMISTLFCVFSVQKVLSFFVYIAFRTSG